MKFGYSQTDCHRQNAGLYAESPRRREASPELNLDDRWPVSCANLDLSCSAPDFRPTTTMIREVVGLAGNADVHAATRQRSQAIWQTEGPRRNPPTGW
jgi:hypothetical protein